MQKQKNGATNCSKSQNLIISLPEDLNKKNPPVKAMASMQS